MSKHTPAPWHVSNGCQIRSDKHQVAKAWMMRDGEGLANAALIAAAPDLLEACTDALADFDAWAAQEGAEPNPQVLAWAKKARATIAKARGEV